MEDFELGINGHSRHKECHLCGGLIIQIRSDDVWVGSTSHDITDCVLNLRHLSDSLEDRINLLESEFAGLVEAFSNFRLNMLP